MVLTAGITSAGDDFEEKMSLIRVRVLKLFVAVTDCLCWFRSDGLRLWRC